MLAAANRLRRAVDFRETARRGSRATRGSVVATIALARGEGQGPARVGLIVGRRVGGSVVRHRVSRRMRAGARPIVADLPAGSMVVLRALPQAAHDNAICADVETAIAAALRKAQGPGS